MISLASIGTSRQGRPLHLLRVSGAPAERVVPAVLIVAGVDARHTVGMEAALGVAERLAADHAGALASAAVYVVPCLNPDGVAFLGDPGAPRMDFGRTIWPHDADRDGRVNEDPAEDLDGDGVIGVMRVPVGGPGWEHTPTHLIDPDEPRLMRTPDPSKGERATHALLIEGIDNDGDGAFNEDGPGGSAGGGTILSMNFPGRYPEHREGAGRHQLSEPEALALATWVLGMESLAAVIVFDPVDTIVNTPVIGKMDPSGGVPLGLENDDKGWYEGVAAMFKEITRMTGAPGGETDGSPAAWAYAHLGVPSFSTCVWVRPDQVKRDEQEAAPAAPAEPAPAEPGAPDGAAAISPEEIRARIAAFESATPAEREAMMAEFRALPADVQARIMQVAQGQPDPGAPAAPAGGGGPARKERKKGDSDDAKWLAYSDESRAGAGFVAWRSFEHPGLGAVEIGGFVPGFRLNPPADEVPGLADEQARFVAGVLGALPRVEWSIRAERLGPGVWRVGARCVNAGKMPVLSAVGVKARRVRPVRASIDLPLESLIAGEKVQRFWNLPGAWSAGAGTGDAEWIVSAPDGSEVRVVVASPMTGEEELRVTLQEVP